MGGGGVKREKSGSTKARVNDTDKWGHSGLGGGGRGRKMIDKKREVLWRKIKIKRVNGRVKADRQTE